MNLRNKKIPSKYFFVHLVKLVYALSLLLILTFAVQGQEKQLPAFDHPLAFEGSETMAAKSINFSAAIPETSINILAVMVAFQEDADNRTSGTGNFDTSSTGRKFLDAPPHDITYFKSHLKFLENYFRKVSDGKLKVQSTLLDSVYRLPNQMRYYSPPRNSIVNTELGLLIWDTWRAVDSLEQLRHNNIPFRQYNAFIVFHAGVGRDVDLASLYGYDPTPFDIPSIYLGPASLLKMGGIFVGGIPVQNDSFHITNSMILPETENRSQVPIPLGLNGLLAASVGSRLGLPDLFNTKTGATGIGRFGLMDGQSIFSWNGAFPPEPSAWEKSFLGWIKPIIISSGDAVYNFPAVSLIGTTDSIYRVPISAKEYFLIENRNRDSDSNGVTITMVFKGDTITKHWWRDTTAFNWLYQDSLFGVVTDVDEFDWSLPGGVDSDTREFFTGGILIWHIDETVIDANLETNTVNADPDRRGVNLMEADGSQDIGQSYDFLHPGARSVNGWPLDFWYAGNSSQMRSHDTLGFTPNSYPNSKSNDGANSHIYINRFSERKARMTARIKIGDEQIMPLAGFPKNTKQIFGTRSVKYITPNWVCLDSGGCPGGLVINTSGYYIKENSPNGQPGLIGPPQIYGWSLTNAPIIESGDSSGLLIQYGNIFRPSPPAVSLALDNFNRDNYFDFTIGGTAGPFYPWNGIQNVIYGWSSGDLNRDHQADSLFTKPIPYSVTTQAVISDSFIAYGGSNGRVYLVRTNGYSIDSIRVNQYDTTDIVGLSLWDKQSARYISVSSGGTLQILSAFKEENILPMKNFSKPMVASAVSGTISASFGKHIAFASKDGSVYLVNDQLNIIPGFPLKTSGEILNTPALADVDGDGQKDIVVFSGNKIYAINASGASLDNFPIKVESEKPLLTSPIVADIDGNGNVDIVAVTQEGLVVAYDKTGKMATGFPLLAGVNSGSTPAAFTIANHRCLSCPMDIGLAVASDDGHVYAWQTGSMSAPIPQLMPWPQYMHDAQNTGLDDSILSVQPRSNEFFPTTLAYNWPNPVSSADGFKTHIRYFVKENAKVHIKIFDPAGDLVTEFDGPGIGGLDNEIEWDVSNIQSGVYFAHIEAKGTNNNGIAVIKIAIIK